MSDHSSVDKIKEMDRRIEKRHLAHFQIRLTDLASPEISAYGQGIDISESGIGVYLPLKFTPGSAVELNVNDSALFGVVTYSIPERSFFRTGIEVWQVLLGRSDLAELLKEAMHEAMPNQKLEYSV
jgi:hypothetical protein